MTSALDRLGPAAVVTQWTAQPVALALAAVLVLGYERGLRRIGRPWRRWRIAVFALGVALLIWASCGVLQVYADSLYWVWTTQTLLLWLLVPIMVLSGHPVQLALELSGPQSVLARVLRSRFCRVVANPLVGPALVPLLSFAMFFGPVPAWTIHWPPVGWFFQLALIAVGGLMVLPLVGLDEDASSLAVGLSLAIGSFELVLDALPGIVLRLRNGLVTSWFDHRAHRSWTPDALHDQRIAGAILWCVAELIDLPFLVLVYRRWIRADARDAAEEDAVLEAERAARLALAGPGAEPDADPEPGRDAPWWLSDPTLQRRYRNEE